MLSWFQKLFRADNESSVFTLHSQRVLALARKEADRFKHPFVGTEHLLLGLIKLDEGVALNVLRKTALDPKTVRAEVEKRLAVGPEPALPGNVPYTPRLKKVLSLAAKEAKALNRTSIDTEHLLLGLMREGDGLAASVLKSFNLDAESVRKEIALLTQP